MYMCVYPIVIVKVIFFYVLRKMKTKIDEISIKIDEISIMNSTIRAQISDRQMNSKRKIRTAHSHLL